MAFYRLLLTFSRRFERPNTWIFAFEASAIRCRIKIGNAEEVSPVDVPLYFRGARYPGRARVSPMADGSWIVGPGDFHEDLPRLELVLIGATSEIAADLMRL